MNELFSFCDDHFKIFILIWLKLREIYTEATKKKISLPFVIKKTSNFLKNIRKQCSKIQRFRKIAKFVYFLEIELTQSERFIDKLQHLALIAEIFELPEPISDIIKHLGLDDGDDLENNVFSKKINDLFKNIDDINIEKKIDIIEDTMQEGTLYDFLKNKNDDKSKFNRNIIPEPVNNKSVNLSRIPQIEQTPNLSYKPIHSFKSVNLSRIPQINPIPINSVNLSRIPQIRTTPNPRTIYRHH
jgi:hypothetical protein